MWDVILDTVIDSVKLIPFLFLTYLVMEYLENKAADKMQNAVKKAGKLGPLFGGILGVVPQCGFSAAATSLYAGRVITLGTLIAIYLSTSDEMLPILISEKSIGTLTIIKILALKMVIGMIAGFLIDFFMRKAITEQGKIRKSIFMNCVSMTTATAEKVAVLWVLPLSTP